jgi:hypothetical protein
MASLSAYYPLPVVAGTTAGTYAEGDDERIEGALPSATAGSGSVLASGSSASRTLSNRFADVVNVKDFGAVGNGSTDDAPAIRAAIAYALTKDSAEIVFPTGTYELSTWSDGTGNTFTGIGQKQILDLFNTTNTRKRYLISGNGSTLTTRLYPKNGLRYPQTSYGALWNVRGNMEVAMRDLNMVSNWQGSGARGLIAEHEARTENPWGILTAIGVNSWDANDQADTRSYINRVETLLIDNCHFLDWTQGVVVNRVGTINVRNSYFAATWGTVSCGTADPAHTACLDIFVADQISVVGNVFNGCVNDDFAQLPTHTVVQNGTPRYRSMDNAILSQCKGMAIFNDNIVEKFCYEGIYSSGYEGSIVSNNIVDNKVPSGHTKLVVNQNIRVDQYEYQSIATGNASTNEIKDQFGMLRNGDIVLFTSKAGGSGITLNQNYYVIECSVTNPSFFKLSDTLGGSPVSLGSNITTSVIRSFNKYGGKALITGNVVHYGGIHLYGAQDSVVSNNIIQLQSRSTTDVNTCYGIEVQNRQNTFEVCNNTLIENNYIFGTNIPSGSGLNQEGGTWDGTVGQSGTNPQISCGIILASGAALKALVRRNTLVLYSKDNASRPIGAFIMDAEVQFVDNYVDGFDFVYGQFGGSNVRRTDVGLVTKNIGRLAGEGQFAGQMPVHLKNSTIKFYPTSTGWYRLLNNCRRSGLVKITIGVSGDSSYGSYVDNDGTNQKLQHTVFSVGGSGYDLDGTGGVSVKEHTIVQHVHTSTATPVVSKVRFGAGGQTYPIWVYINSVTTRWELAFSGGGGSGAAGYVTSTNGVINSGSAVITNGGTNYTSAPIVTIRNPSYNPSTDIQGSGATFTASLSGNSVESVSVNSGGSGYAGAITVIGESDIYDLQVPSILRIFAQDPTDNFGIELSFQQGSKSITRVGGYTNGRLVGNGPPLIATTAPASVPEFIGQQYINTSTGIAYLAVGTLSSSDWKAISFWEP